MAAVKTLPALSLNYASQGGLRENCLPSAPHFHVAFLQAKPVNRSPAALTEIFPTRDHLPTSAERWPFTEMRDPFKLQLQPRGNIVSQALTVAVVAEQPGVWCIVGASRMSSSGDLFCSVLHLLGTRTKVW